MSELIYPFGAEQIRSKINELRFLGEHYNADRWERILRKKFQKTADDEPVPVILKTERALELETKGWEVWLKTLSPHTFSHKFVKEIGDFWEWYWPLILAQAEGKHLIDITDTLAYTLFLARGMSKCLAKGTSVLLADGTSRPIENLSVGDKILSVDQVTGRSVIDKVRQIWANGKKECFRVRTKTNKSLILSADHRLWSFEGWCELKDLKIGDRIAVPRYTRPEVSPRVVCDEEVRLLAYMLAEGGTGSYYVRRPSRRREKAVLESSCAATFTNSDPILVEDFTSCANTLGFTVRKRVGMNYSYGLRGAQDWLRKTGLNGCRSWEKSVPRWVFSLPERQRWLFLGVLMDTDGWFDGTGGSHSGICLSSEQLLRDIAAIFLSVGVVSRFVQVSEAFHGAWRITLDHEGLKRCTERMPLLLKGGTLARLHQTLRYSLCDVYPTDVGSNLPWGKGYELQRAGVRVGKKKYAVITRNKLRRAVEIYPFPRWLWLEQADVMWDRIESIEPVGEVETYDIETSNYHNFIADGIVSHNSVTMEWAALMEGAIVGPSLILYTCSTGKTATRHLQSITIHAERSLMEEYYPGLARPRVGKHKNRFGWNKEMLAADCGMTALAVGLEEEIRGVRVEDLKPTLVALDDFDSLKDSPDVVKKKEDIIGGSILGTQTEDTIIIAGQNLIHRFSIARRIHLGRSELLRDRRSSGVIKAFSDDFEMEQQPNGRYKITKGTPNWEGFNMKLAQKIVGTMGPILARAEFQHEFDTDHKGKVMKNYLDGVHVITEEEFCQPYALQWHPAFKMPFDWWKYMFNDYARTKSEFHANVAGTLTVSSMNTKLPGVTFLFDCLSFEENTEPDDCAIAFLRCISPLVRVDGVDRDWDILRQTLVSREGIANYVGSKTEKIRAERAALARVFPEHVAPLLQAYNYRMFRMSHEKDDWAKIYRNTFGLPFDRPAPNDDAGQALLDLAMKIDWNVKDPFGRVGYWADDKQTFIRDPFNKSGKAEPLMGMARWYMLVKSDKLSYPNDARPDQLHGSDLARYQFNEQRYLSPKANELGEEERDAEKRNDDFRQGILMYYFDNSLRGRELSKVEEQELQLPEAVQLQAITNAPPQLREKLLHSREIELRQREFERLEKNLARGGGSSRGNKLVGYRRLRRNSV